jgi:colanic acid biosynthesis glycosyl transferase WcaI
MTRIGVISQWYDPEGGSAAVPGAISRSLVALGHQVDVLTGFPNYPAGRLYPGYRLRPYQFESRDGVSVHRVPLVPSHDRSALRRAGSYLSFACSATLRQRVLRAADVWLVYSTPATVALPALVAHYRYGRPYVLLIQDLWPDTVVESGFVNSDRALRAITRGLHRFCDATYRGAAAIAVSAPGMVDVLRERGVPADKLSVLPSWVDERMFRPVERDRVLAHDLGLSGFVVMYAGSLGDLQGLETVIEALDHLGDVEDMTLAFVGSGVADGRLRELAASRTRHKVLFLGQQPIDRMAEIMALSDVQLVCLRDLPLFRSTLPSKVQATLATGRPIVASVPGDAARLVDASGAGVAVRPGDPVALAAALRKMYRLSEPERQALGRRGRRFYLDTLSERVGSAALSGLLTKAAREGVERHGASSSEVAS